MKTKIKNAPGIIIVLIALLGFCTCNKDDDSLKEESGFVLSSPEIGADSLLPIEYTCDGVSATLPLNWSGAPEEVVSFASHQPCFNAREWSCKISALVCHHYMSCLLIRVNVTVSADQNACRRCGLSDEALEYVFY